MSGEKSTVEEPSRGGSETIRRAEDRLDVRGAARMLEVLAGRPTPDGLAQELALGTLSRFKPKVILIDYLSSGAQLLLAGSFGLSESAARSLAARSIWESSPMAEAVRSGAPVEVSVSTSESGESWGAHLGSEVSTFVAIPLTMKDQKLGALGLGFDGSFTGLDPHSDLSGVAVVLALYLSLQVDAAPSVASTNGKSAVAADGRRSATGLAGDPTDVENMSDRRRQVLRLLANGFTNSQIAYRIGFSESTVRHETMAIYRMLGATDRRDAARIAETLGLLADSDPSPRQ